jgi:hypothetical protein
MKTKINNIPQAAEDVNVEAVKEMLPASPAVAVDNDEKYIPFLMIFAVQLIGSCISLINLGAIRPIPIRCRHLHWLKPAVTSWLNAL